MASRAEPPVDPPTSHWCARCERELRNDVDRVEIRGLTYCPSCARRMP